MRTKLSVVKDHMASQRWQDAIRIAARFPQLGEQRSAILDAHTAYTNPRWSLGLGHDLAALKEAGRLALIARFGE